MLSAAWFLRAENRRPDEAADFKQRSRTLAEQVLIVGQDPFRGHPDRRCGENLRLGLEGTRDDPVQREKEGKRDDEDQNKRDDIVCSSAFLFHVVTPYFS